MLMRNDKGVALVIVIISMMVLSVFGATMVAVSASETTGVTRQHDQMQAYYAAWSGANMVAHYIMENPDSLPDMRQFVNRLIVAGKSGSVDLGEAGEFSVLVTRSGQHIVIESKGLSGKAAETVTLTLLERTGWFSPAFDVAVFGNQSFVMNNNSQATGNVGSNSNSSFSIDMRNNTRIDGNVMVGVSANLGTAVRRGNNSVITGVVRNLDKQRIYPLPPFPAFPADLPYKGSLLRNNNSTGSITGNGYYDSIQFNNNSTLTINLSGDTLIRVRSLSLGNNSSIVLAGSGTLSLYVENSFSLGNNSTVNHNGNTASLFMYYKGGNELSLAGNNSVFNGTVFAQTADIDIENNASIKGHIISGGSKIEISNNVEAMVRAIYAPLATIELKNNVAITGAVIGNIVDMSNNTSVIFSTAIKDGIAIPDSSLVGYSLGLWK